MLQSTRADSPFCERIEVRFADPSLKVAAAAKSFQEVVVFVIEVEGVKQTTSPWRRHLRSSVREVSLVVLTLEGRVLEVIQSDLFNLHCRL